MFNLSVSDLIFTVVYTFSKTLLKLTIPRIKLLRNRREIQLKNMRREIANLLETGQEATARIRVYLKPPFCFIILILNQWPRTEGKSFWYYFSFVVLFLMCWSIQVEHIIREENMMAAQEIIELFCELIAVRLPIIESQRYSSSLNLCDISDIPV